MAFCLQSRRSSADLPAQPSSDKTSVGEPIVVYMFFDLRVFLVFDSPAILFLGGDPSAGSPTDTLLRLNPAY
jgi:hypothetical protein